MAPVVQLKTVVALAGRFPALSGLDLTVTPGEVVAVLGPNGAGKTSLLRSISGLLPIASGKAVVLGQDLSEDRSKTRGRIGFLGHTAPIYGELTAASNVKFQAKACRVSMTRVGPALERVGLVGRLARTQTQLLSAGQRRRVAIACLLARGPTLWLLDEPHAGLDASTRELLAAIFKEAVGGGATVIFSSHETNIAVPLADRVVEMGGGRIIEERVGLRSTTRRSNEVHVA